MLLGAEEEGEGAGSGVGVPFEIFRGEHAAGFGGVEFLSGGDGGGECAGGEFEAVGGPGIGLLLRAGMEDEQ